METKKNKRKKTITRKKKSILSLPMITAIKMEKKKRSRFPNVDTYKLDCHAKNIIGYRSIKSAEEAGIDEDNFVHVLLSTLGEYEFPVIVKIHEEDSFFVKHEIEILEKIQDFENHVPILCHFGCIDEKERWVHPVTRTIQFCNNKKDRLHFFVFPYLENARIEEFMSQNPSISLLKSLFLQITMSLFVLQINYGVLHGDLNSGNILIDKTEEKEIIYSVDGYEPYAIQSYGIFPRFIDWGRSKSMEKLFQIVYIFDDVFTLLEVITHWIPDNVIKEKIKKRLMKEYQKRTENIFDFIRNMEVLFE